MKDNNRIRDINLNEAWARYKTNYLFGLPGLPNIIRGVYLYVLPTGFYFCPTNKRSAFYPLLIQYKNIVQLDFLVGTGTPHYNNFGLNKIDNLMQVTFLVNGKYFSFRFEIADSSIDLNHNQAKRHELYILLKNRKIFEKFVRPVRSTGGSNSVSENKADIFAQIEKLGELHKSGILTDEEFQKKKEELLKRI